MSKSTVRLRIFKNNTAAVAFGDPFSTTNTLDITTLTELNAIFDDIIYNKKVKFLTFQSYKEGEYISGTPLKDLNGLSREKDLFMKISSWQAVLKKIEKLTCPTLAVINGKCGSAGLQLALHCKYRMATDHPQTQIGFPEIKQGILPYLGGVKKLLDVVAVDKAVPLLTSGDFVSGKEAFDMGLVDAYVAESFLTDKIREFADQALAKKVKRQKLGLFASFKEKYLRPTYSFSRHKKELLKETRGLDLAPLEMLDLVKKVYRKHNKAKIFKFEVQAFYRVFTSRKTRNKIHVNGLIKALQKGGRKHPQKCKNDRPKAAVIGAGTNGSAVAYHLTKAGYTPRLIDLTWDNVAAGLAKVKAHYQVLLDQKKITPKALENHLDLVSGTAQNQPLHQLGLVWGGLPQDLATQQKTFKGLEARTSAEAIYISSLAVENIEKVATPLKNPGRLIGAHLHAPLRSLPLMEIMPHAKTTEETIDTLFKVATDMGVVPIQVQNMAGGVVNRLLAIYLNEAALMVEEGAEAEFIDTTLETFGMTAGPLKLMDEMGVDAAAALVDYMHHSYGYRFTPATIFSKMIEDGTTGKKDQKGFYNYKLIDKGLAAAKKSFEPKKPTVSEKDIINRCILIMVNEAAQILEDGVVTGVPEIDVATILGLGFPDFRGGLLKYADGRTLDKIVDRLVYLSKQYGQRFDPIPLLCDMGQQGSKFY